MLSLSSANIEPRSLSGSVCTKSVIPVNQITSIQAWIVPFALLRECGHQLHCLSADERKRAKNRVTARAELDFTVARSFLRTVLASQMNYLPNELNIQYTPNGKPYIPNGPAFNLSHCDQLLAVAVAEASFTGKLGIDVETRRADPNVLRLANKCFTSSERAQLHMYKSNEMKLGAFTRGWTRKEAVVKAIGTGLRTPLNSFNVSLQRCNENDNKQTKGRLSLLQSSMVDGISLNNCELCDLGSRFDCEVALAIVHNGMFKNSELHVHNVDMHYLNALVESNYG